jgi:hypothetical protein
VGGGSSGSSSSSGGGSSATLVIIIFVVAVVAIAVIFVTVKLVKRHRGGDDASASQRSDVAWNNPMYDTTHDAEPTADKDGVYAELPVGGDAENSDVDNNDESGYMDLPVAEVSGGYMDMTADDDGDV